MKEWNIDNDWDDDWDTNESEKKYKKIPKNYNFSKKLKNEIDKFINLTKEVDEVCKIGRKPICIDCSFIIPTKLMSFTKKRRKRRLYNIILVKCEHRGSLEYNIEDSGCEFFNEKENRWEF